MADPLPAAPRLGAVARLRSILMANVAAWALALVIGGVVTLFRDGSFLSSLGFGAVIAGAILALSANSVLDRAASLESSRWGISVNRHRDEAKRDETVGDLTGVGVAIFAGIPTALIGMYLIGL